MRLGTDVIFFVVIFEKKNILDDRWIGTREWRSQERIHQSMRTRLGLQVRGGCATISHTP